MAKKYTIEEIRNYIQSCDSVDELIFGISEDKIAEANHKENIPMYVDMNGSALRYIKDDGQDKDVYYRDAGAWSVGWKFLDDKLISVCDDMGWLHGVELKEITYDEWALSNRGYLPGQERELDESDLPY